MYGIQDNWKDEFSSLFGLDVPVIALARVFLYFAASGYTLRVHSSANPSRLHRTVCAGCAYSARIFSKFKRHTLSLSIKWCTFLFVSDALARTLCNTRFVARSTLPYLTHLFKGKLISIADHASTWSVFCKLTILSLFVVTLRSCTWLQVKIFRHAQLCGTEGFPLFSCVFHTAIHHSFFQNAFVISLTGYLFLAEAAHRNVHAWMAFSFKGDELLLYEFSCTHSNARDINVLESTASYSLSDVFLQDYLSGSRACDSVKPHRL